VAFGGATVADAVTKRTTNQTTGSASATPKGSANEAALTGDALKSASDAAIAANAAKVISATTEDPAENTGAAYEVHITKADGTRATVLEDSSFKVLSTPHKAAADTTVAVAVTPTRRR
jgi:hypothetical protein